MTGPENNVAVHPSTHCPVCKSPLSKESDLDRNRNAYRFQCLLCGEYEATWDAAINVLPKIVTIERSRLSGAIRERHESHNRGEDWLLVDGDNMRTLLESAPGQNNVSVKMRKLLSAVARQTVPGEPATFPTLRPIHWPTPLVRSNGIT